MTAISNNWTFGKSRREINRLGGKFFSYLYLVMRRMYAIILMIPVLILFGGMAGGRGKCLKAASHQGCNGCARTCDKAKTDKSGRKDKDAGGCCVDCPLCYLVTIKPSFKWESARQVTTIEYTVMSDNNLCDYFQRHWKPPCTALFS
jgi:hypothetical protein